MLILRRATSRDVHKTRVEITGLADVLRDATDRATTLDGIAARRIAPPPRPIVRAQSLLIGGGPRDVLGLDEWAEAHQYHLRCLLNAFRRRWSNDALVDWDGLESDLVRYAYWTSANRYLSYRIIK
jgi:hypothetical protein